MSHHIWFEHFKEQLQGLRESFEQGDSSLSLLGYALKEKILSSEDYLKWAMTQYNLPQLQSRFFTETPLSQEMFAKWATHYPWSAECLPVAEWDGSLIVACLQPPQDFPSKPSCILVLATYENLQASWQKLHPVATPMIDNSSMGAPEGIDLSASTATQKISSPEFSADDLGALSSADPSDGLVGLLDTPSVVHLQTINEVSEVSKDEKTEILAAPPEVAPILELIPDPVPVAKSVPPAKKESPEEFMLSEAVTRVHTPPPPPLRSAALATPEEDSLTNIPVSITPRPAGIAKPVIAPVSSGNFVLEKLKKKNAAAFAEKVTQILNEMKAHFEKSMILTLDEQETQLAAFAWDENFQGIKDTSMRFPLKTPSIFNIVATTQKPFHGYISLNEINEKFFEDWNKGIIPDHVTITPIIVGEKIVGMLMGFAEKSSYNKASLTLAEKLSSDFAKGLQAA